MADDIYRKIEILPFFKGSYDRALSNGRNIRAGLIYYTSFTMKMTLQMVVLFTVVGFIPYNLFFWKPPTTEMWHGLWKEMIYYRLHGGSMTP